MSLYLPVFVGTRALAIDPSTPAVASINGAAISGTTNAFSPPAKSVIILAVQGCGNSNSTVVSSVSDSLGVHLTWTRLAHALYVPAGAFDAFAEVWYAPCPSAQTSMTVTATYSGALYTPNGAVPGTGAILPIVFTGASSTQAGATNTANSASGVVSCSVSGTATGSWIVGVVATSTATGPTVPAGQTTTINGSSSLVVNGTTGLGDWTQILTAPSGGGAQTINDTAPVSQDWAMAVVEVQA